MGIEAVVTAGVIGELAGAGAAFSFLAGEIGASLLSSFALNFVSSAVMSAFKDTPSSVGSAAFQQEASGRQQMVRSSVADRRVVYGQCKVSGPIIYGATIGDNSSLALVVVLADHEVAAIDDIFFNDEAIPPGSIGNGAGVGPVTSGKYAGFATIYKYLGGAGQTYDANLGSVDSNWDATKVGNGVAYIVVFLQWDRTVYSSGIPNIAALVRGKKLEEVRETGSPTVYNYSANWANVILDYLKNSSYGMNCSPDEINTASFIAAANTSDERVLLPTSSPTSDSVFNSFTCAGSLITSGFKEILQTGDGVRFTGASRPVELSLATTYYWIRALNGSGYLATSFANAFAGNSMTLTDGSGDMAYYDQARYEAQGTISTSETPMSALKSLLPAGAGTLVWQQGQWYLYAGVYRATAGTLTISDLRAPMDTLAQPSRRDLYNQVRGVFSDPNSAYQPMDFPITVNAAYEAADGERMPHDISLQFTVNSFRAQRIAKIFLEKSRQGMVVNFPAKPSALKYAVWDTVSLTIAAMGWSAKDFIVTGWTLNPDGGVDLQLQEESSASYTWSSSDATLRDQAPDTDLSDPNDVDDIAGLALSSGTADLFIAADGTVHSRIRATWNAVANAFVRSGGAIELQYAARTVSPTQWEDAPTVGGDASQAYVLPVEDGITYDVRIRARSSTGAVGEWVYSAETVVGKSAAPSDVTGASALQTGAVVLFACDTVMDSDLDSIEIRYGDEGEMDVENASPIANILRGQTATTAALPPGTWEIFFRAKDTSGNFSDNASRVTLSVTSDGFTAISTATYNPNWIGALTNMIEHWTGVIVPDSQSLASALGWEVFDEFVPNAYTDCYFTGTIIDKGIDGAARIYADIVSVLGPGETSGVAAPGLEIDSRLAAGSFDGFETWTIGNENFRYAQGRIHVDTTIGKPVISEFTLTLDAASRTESGVLAVSGGGSASQSFTSQFNSVPILQLTPVGSGDVSASYDSLTALGFTGYFKTAGVAGAGSISWTATGV